MERLEDRRLLVIGAFEIPPLVAPGTGFDGVVALDFSNSSTATDLSSGCTGALLSTGMHILTAAHCVTNTSGARDVTNLQVVFDLSDQNYVIDVDLTSAGVLSIPTDWNGDTDDGADFAIIELPVVAPFPAERYDIFSATNEIDNVFTIVGYGHTGTGTTGQLIGGIAQKRIGFNEIGGIANFASGDVIQYDFDDGAAGNNTMGDSFGLGATEALTGQGDSGSPWIMSGRFIAAVTSFGGLGFGATDNGTRLSGFTVYINGVLNADSDVVLDMNLQPAGNNGIADTITARYDPADGTRMQLLISGEVIWSDLVARVDSLTITGSGDDDTFVIDGDFNINVTVSGGLGFDSLEIIGDGVDNATYSPHATISGNGQITIGVDLLTFTGLEPITVSNLASYTLVTPNAADVITVDNPQLGRTRVSGTSDSVPFESVTFFDIDSFTIDALANDGGGAADTIEVATPLAATGLSSFTINTGDGNDQLTTGSDFSLTGNPDSFSWNAGAGTDTLHVSGDANYTLTNASLVASGPEGAGTLTLTSTVEAVTLTAGASNNTINAAGFTLGGVTIAAGPGNDTLTGGSGIDIIHGGDGNDTLIGGPGDDSMFGGADSDTLIWNNGDNNDLMEGGTGNDRVIVNGAGAAANGDNFAVSANGSRVSFQRTNLIPFTLDISQAEQLDVNTLGSDGVVADQVTIDSLLGTELEVVNFDGGPENGNRLIVNGTDAAETITITNLVSAATPFGAILGLGPIIAMNSFDGDFGNQLTINGLGGNDVIDGSAQGLPSPPLYVFNGGLGDDTLIGSPALDTLNGGDGEDTLSGGGGNDTLDGGDGYDTLLISGTSGNDVITLNQTSATTLSYTIGPEVGPPIAELDTLVLLAGVRTVERVLVEAGNGDDIVSVTWADALGVDATRNALRMDVNGGAGFTRDRLGVIDSGTGDLVLMRKGPSNDTGSVTIGPANAEPLEANFEGMEFIQPVAVAGGRVEVFKFDPYEFNDAYTIATHLGAGETINVDPTIDPGAAAGLPGDQDFFRFDALNTGTLDLQVFFETIVTVGSGRPGLPGGGDLNIQVQDSNGDVIGNGTALLDSGAIAIGERIAIPVVRNQTYFIRVVGATGEAINIYDLTAINIAAPVPQTIDLQLASDSGRNGTDDVTNTALATFDIVLNDDRIDEFTNLNLLPDTTNDDSQTVGFDYGVQVFNNGAPIGFAFYTGTGNLWRFTATAGDLNEGHNNFITAATWVRDRATPTVIGTSDQQGPINALQITLDTIAPPKSFGSPAVVNDGLHPDSDSHVESLLVGTRIDRITNDTSPTLFGVAEANTIVRVYADVNGNSALDLGVDVLIGQTVATPTDGTNQFPSGEWSVTSTIDMNDPTFFPATDGLRTLFVLAEDVAGNVMAAAAADALEIFIDTAGPQVTSVTITGDPDFDLFEVKPSQGPTPLVTSLSVGIQDLPFRVDQFLYQAIASAAGITEVEGNDSIAAAQDIDGLFSLFFNADVGDTAGNTSTAIPHASINGSGDGTFDFYSFQVANAGDRGIFDIDFGIDGGANTSFDSELFLFAADGTLLASNDDTVIANGAGGTSSDLDAYLEHTFAQAGTYFIAVAQFPSTGQNGGVITGDAPEPGVTYTLQVSLENYPDPNFADGIPLSPGLIEVVGDANGIIAIESVVFIPGTVADGFPATGTIQIDFAEPLPDDRFTLTISDSLTDPAGNALDGESTAGQPNGGPVFPSGDGQPGGDFGFAARFNIDTRPEVAVWSGASVHVDTNGNFRWDPFNLDEVNRDITYNLGFVTDYIFSGNFAPIAGVASGFDKVATYGLLNGTFRWLIDSNDDGVPDIIRNNTAFINGTPVSGNFSAGHSGDEIGVFNGTTWFLDSNGNYNVDPTLEPGDQRIVSALRGYPFVADIDDDGLDDLATYNENFNRFEFDLAANGFGGATADRFIVFDISGVTEKPVAHDMDGDGVDDIGVFVPHRTGASPQEFGEWYFFISGDGTSLLNRVVTNGVHPTTSAIDWSPTPFGHDLFVEFGDEFALPLVGNFDPPIAGGLNPLPEINGIYTNPDDALDVNGVNGITIADALQVVSRLRGYGTEQIVNSTYVTNQTAPFFDVTHDGSISIGDAIEVIAAMRNALLEAASGGEGEAASTPALPVVAPPTASVSTNKSAAAAAKTATPGDSSEDASAIDAIMASYAGSGSGSNAADPVGSLGGDDDYSDEALDLLFA